MSQRTRRTAKGPTRPQALPTDTILAQHTYGNVYAREALSLLFQQWTEAAMKRMQERLTSSEPAALARDELQRLLESLSQPTDKLLLQAIDQAIDQKIKALRPISQVGYERIVTANVIKHDDEAITALRQHFGRWSKIEGADIMRVFLSDEANSNGEAEQFLDGLKLSPNRAFTWRLLFPSVGSWPVALSSFKQQLWVTKTEFIHDCISNLGRPLPLMELAEVFEHMPDLDMLERTIQQVLTPPELAYALAFGAFQLEVNVDGQPGAWPPNRPRLRLNPLFTTSR